MKFSGIIISILVGVVVRIHGYPKVVVFRIKGILEESRGSSETTAVQNGSPAQVASNNDEELSIFAGTSGHTKEGEQFLRINNLGKNIAKNIQQYIQNDLQKKTNQVEIFFTFPESFSLDIFWGVKDIARSEYNVEDPYTVKIYFNTSYEVNGGMQKTLNKKARFQEILNSISEQRSTCVGSCNVKILEQHQEWKDAKTIRSEVKFRGGDFTILGNRDDTGRLQVPMNGITTDVINRLMNSGENGTTIFINFLNNEPSDGEGLWLRISPYNAFVTGHVTGSYFNAEFFMNLHPQKVELYITIVADKFLDFRKVIVQVPALIDVIDVIESNVISILTKKSPRDFTSELHHDFNPTWQDCLQEIKFGNWKVEKYEYVGDNVHQLISIWNKRAPEYNNGFPDNLDDMTFEFKKN